MQQCNIKRGRRGTRLSDEAMRAGDQFSSVLCAVTGFDEGSIKQLPEFDGAVRVQGVAPAGMYATRCYAIYSPVDVSCAAD